MLPSSRQSICSAPLLPSRRLCGCCALNHSDPRESWITFRVRPALRRSAPGVAALPDYRSSANVRRSLERPYRLCRLTPLLRSYCADAHGLHPSLTSVPSPLPLASGCQLLALTEFSEEFASIPPIKGSRLPLRDSTTFPSPLCAALSAPVQRCVDAFLGFSVLMDLRALCRDMQRRCEQAALRWMATHLCADGLRERNEATYARREAAQAALTPDLDSYREEMVAWQTKWQSDSAHRREGKAEKRRKRKWTARAHALDAWVSDANVLDAVWLRRQLDRWGHCSRDPVLCVISPRDAKDGVRQAAVRERRFHFVVGPGGGGLSRHRPRAGAVQQAQACGRHRCRHPTGRTAARSQPPLDRHCGAPGRRAAGGQDDCGPVDGQQHRRRVAAPAARRRARALRAGHPELRATHGRARCQPRRAARSRARVRVRG